MRSSYRCAFGPGSARHTRTSATRYSRRSSNEWLGSRSPSLYAAWCRPGGTLSTTGDLVNWVDGVRGGRIVKARNVPLLYRLAIGPPGGPVAYGGANMFGFQGVIVELPREPALIVVLTNSNVLPRFVADEVARGLEERIVGRRP